jgi:hypothetical protein
MYEQACLREVMNTLSGVDVTTPGERVPITIHGVYLSGKRPDTEIVVVLSRDGPPTSLAWGLWGDDFGEVHDEENRASPGAVADDIEIQVYEF